jgi:23S rRNA-/tRNA-specific pseudouridylate synthase
MVYVDKPSGLHTHRLRPDDPPAVADFVAARVSGCADASQDPREAGVVHRLDEGTSGVLAFARDRDTWTRAREAFSNRRVGKLYVAAVHAKPRTPWPALGFDPAPRPPADMPPTIGRGVRIDARLGDGPDRQVVVRADGRSTCTDVWCLRLHRRFGVEARAFVLVSLSSGHRHQARVHLATIGWPIVGDPRYGIGGRSRLMLHAARLDLGAAIVGEPTIVAPWPAPIQAAWARLCDDGAPGFLRIRGG